MTHPFSAFCFAFVLAVVIPALSQTGDPPFSHPSAYVTAQMEDDAASINGEPSRFSEIIAKLNALKAVTGVSVGTVEKIDAGVAAIHRMSVEHNMDDFGKVIEMSKELVQLYQTTRGSEQASPALEAAFASFATQDGIDGFPDDITFFVDVYLSVYIDRYSLPEFQLPVPAWVIDGMLDLMQMCGGVSELSNDHGYFTWMFSRHWEKVSIRLATLPSAQRVRVYDHVQTNISRSEIEGYGAPMTPKDGALAAQRVHWARTHLP